VSQLLREWSNGYQAALDKVMPIVYQELHWLAHHDMAVVSEERSAEVAVNDAMR